MHIPTSWSLWTSGPSTGNEMSRCGSQSAPEYGLPMDDQELDRIDMCHAKYYALLEKKRFLAPIGDNPQKILDLGCGTGESLSSCGAVMVASCFLVLPPGDPSPWLGG